MRDGIVHVQKVEFIDLRHFGHAGREGQVIRRVIKQRVVGNFDFVIRDIWLRLSEPDWWRVSDEVYLVPAMRQLYSDLSHNFGASAKRRIGCRSNFHQRFEESRDSSADRFDGSVTAAIQ